MMDRKRIAFDARFINDRYHGIGRFAFQLLKHMVLVAPDYDFMIYRGNAPNGRFDWSDIGNLPNVSLQGGPTPLYLPTEQLVWPIYLKRDGIDLFHSPYFSVPLLANTPVILTVHDMIFERFPQYMPGVWLRPYYKFLMNLGLRKSKKVVAVSKSTAKDLKDFYRFSVEKLAVVPEGVDESFLPIEDPNKLEQVRERYHLRAPYVLSVGARRPHKNYERLIRAFYNLSGEFSHDLVLVGPADNRFPDVVQGELARTDLNGRVKQLNWIPESDLPAIYALADFVVLPSILEGFGLPALEAMACGTPVIAANNSSFPEVVGDTGILVDPYEVADIERAMRLLMSDHEKRKQLGSAGRERSKEFSWDIAARRILVIYRELLA